MRYQQVIVQRLEKMENLVQRLEYGLKTTNSREESISSLKELREFIVDTQELAKREQ